MVTNSISLARTILIHYIFLVDLNLPPYKRGPATSLVIPGRLYVPRPMSCLAVAFAVFSVSFTSAQLFQ